MKSTSSIKRSGFTLIELLTVIAIIGVLAAVLFPGVQGVMKMAKKSTASTKLRNIVQAVISFSDSKKYIKSGSWSITNNSSAGSIGEYAAVLAYNSNLNSGELWYVDADKSNENASFPKQILTGAVGAQQIDENFKNPSDAYGYHAWTAYTPTLKNVNGNVPLLWTRGLETTGTWRADDGVWGADGGHIGWGDSHVIWTENTANDGNGVALFLDRSLGSPTPDWKKAVSEGTITELSSK
jgi:prepilin-type N-terminal cleavage/methylation domain-containing protein